MPAAVALAKQCRHVKFQGVEQMTTGNARRDTEWEQQRSKLCVFRPGFKDTLWTGCIMGPHQYCMVISDTCLLC